MMEGHSTRPCEANLKAPDVANCWFVLAVFRIVTLLRIKVEPLPTTMVPGTIPKSRVNVLVPTASAIQSFQAAHDSWREPTQAPLGKQAARACRQEGHGLSSGKPLWV